MLGKRLCQFTVILFMVFLMTLSNSIKAADNERPGAPSNVEMIKQRLKSDIKDLEQENEKLRRKIKRLEQRNSSYKPRIKNDGSSPTESLKKENQRLRKVIASYRRFFQQIAKRVESADSIYQRVLKNSSQNTGSQRSTSMADQANMTEDRTQKSGDKKWIQKPERPYPIRETPLREEMHYTTSPEDTLSKLAHQYYHDAALWREIYLENKTNIDNPNRLPPGTKLRLPPINQLKK